MRIILRQTFPLGRFHATRWNINPFDERRSGEWPPSPWRLIRAIVARWYQWARETREDDDPRRLDELVDALCTSEYAFNLPENALRGKPLRQYLPVEFGWNPKEKKKAGIKSYSTSLAQDNYWCVPDSENGPVWWFLVGDNWTNPAIQTLDRCLERIVYFGRAETFTRIRRALESLPQPNCTPTDQRTPDAVPLLVPQPDAQRVDVERLTDDTEVVGRPVPPGARLMYASLPKRRPSREKVVRSIVRKNSFCLQFAIGSNVPPEIRSIVRLTARFRGSAIQELVRLKTGDPKATWSRTSASIREAVAEMTGKDAKGKALTGPHRHTEFLAWCEDGVPTRLLVWRDGRPFDGEEQKAILRAASREFSWAATGPDQDTWKVKFVPLDRAVPPPPGFDGVATTTWESLTPYVPPRHYLRKGKPRPRESLESQVRRELSLRGFANANDVEVETFGTPCWVAVHTPRRRKRTIAGDRRGYWLRVTFPEPIGFPLRLGHSSTFGLGLFRPVLSDADTIRR